MSEIHETGGVNVGTPSLEARNIRLVNIITYIIEESKLISENMSPNVIHG
jgi:hypothetical protein